MKEGIGLAVLLGVSEQTSHVQFLILLASLGVCQGEVFLSARRGQNVEGPSGHGLSDPHVCLAFVQFQCDGLSAPRVAATARGSRRLFSQEVSAGDPVPEKGDSA